MYGTVDPDCPVDLDKLTASIKAHEGTGPLVMGRFIPYRDTRGNLTVGYGRNLSTDGISPSEAGMLLGNDLQSCIRTAQAEAWWPYVKDNDARARAFIEIGFNIGFSALRGFHDALGAASRGDWAGCAASLLDSLWARQVGARAEIIAAMVHTGTD